MKITEIISEAHHSIVHRMKIGQWTIHIDSHALVSAPHKNVSIEDFTNIVIYSSMLPDVYQTIPIGKGVFFQDVNTMISIYVKRISENDLRVETVLPKSEIPKPPMFRRPVPANKIKRSKKQGEIYNTARTDSLKRGRDEISQDIEKIASLPPLNRQQKRELDKRMRRSK